MNNFKTSVFTNDRLLDLSLFEVGWQSCTPLHSHGSFIRTHYVFHFILSGKGSFSYTDSHGTSHHHQLTTNQGFLISPNQIISYTADELEPWEYLWIEFDGLLVKEELARAGLNNDLPIYQLKDDTSNQKITKKILYLLQTDNLSTSNITGNFYLLLDELAKHSSTTQPLAINKQSDYYLSKALSYIHHHYQQTIRVEEIADFCNLNRSYFTKLFKDKLKITPQEFIIQYRMDKAELLLVQTDLPINIIGQAVGYQNQLHFSKAFKSIYKISPSQFRQIKRNNL